jgi:serine/threonine-protein kinase
MSQGTAGEGKSAGGRSHPGRIGGYRLLEPLGTGGMSNVYRAMHLESGAIVAVKVLPRSLARNATMLQRFLREARVAQSLLDPHIVEILDRGCEDGRYFIVLEYLPGGDLSERVKINGPLKPHEAVAVVEGVARGLRHAAEQQLIHRDIKPANILIGPDGRAKVADLGLALRLEDEDQRVTRDGTTVGTVDYMAPEQARDSRACSVRSDIYSLGCTLHYLLTGEPPFAGGDVPDKLRRHAFDPPPDPRALNPSVPEPLARLAMRMMDKDPRRRFGDYDELLAALEALPLTPSGEVGEALRDDEARPVAPPRPAEAEPTQAWESDADAVPPAPAAATRSEPTEARSEWEAPRPDTARYPGPRADEWAAPPPRRSRTSEVQARWLRVGLAAIGLVAAALAVKPLIDRLGDAARRQAPLVEAGRAASEEAVGGAAMPAAGYYDVPARTETASRAEAPWTEPDAAPPGPPPRRVIDAGTLAALGLEGLAPPAATPAPTPVVAVRRLAADRAAFPQSSLRKGLDALSGTVELADDGPFFEGDLRVGGGSRARRRIAAAAGHRPMIVLERPALASVRGRAAAIPLDGKHLELVGVDLVVDARDLDPRQRAIFRVQGGGSLLLRDCTVTVEAPAGAGSRIALFEAGGEGGGTVTLDRTLVRGSGRVTPARLDGGGVLTAWDSWILTTVEPLVEIAGAAWGEGRRVALLGTTLVAGVPWVERAEGADGALAWRAAGCVLARPGEDSPTAAPGVDWKGVDNRFVGAEPPAGEERADWAEGAGKDVVWDLNGWSTAEATAAALDLPDNGAAARPRPGLEGWTFGRFALEPTAEAESDAGEAILDFDADDPAHGGDLGRFLAEKAEGTSIRVRARGAGRKWMTPIRLRPGTRLTVEVKPPAGPDLPPLVWAPREGSAGEALIGGRDVELTLRGARFERDAGPALQALIWIEQGRLLVEDTWLRAASEAEPGGGNLIVLVGEGTRPLFDGRSAPSATFRRSVLLTGGTAIAARLGRGLVALEGCAVAAGRAAFRLEPAEGVSPSRFATDLSLERCTVVAERDVVRLGPWAGAAAPDRPWLVVTTRCAFLDPFDRGGAPPTVALLRADEAALARGVLAWQSHDDAFDLGSVFAVGEEDPAAVSFREAARSWAAFWGPGHVVGARDARELARLATSPLEPADFVPDDLRLVPTAEGVAIDFGADADALGLAPASATRRPANRSRVAPRPDGPGMPARTR